MLETRDLAPGAVVFTVAEEGLGNLRGAHAACEVLRPDGVIALEGHGLDAVVVDAVGSVRARIVVRCPGGHSWSDRGSPSAIHILLETAGELLAQSTPETPVNIGVIAGGRTINSIAEEAHLMLEMRATEEEPLELFVALLESTRHNSGISVSVEAVGRRRAGRLPRDSALLAAVRHVRDEIGLPDRLESVRPTRTRRSRSGSRRLARGLPGRGDAHPRRAHRHDLARARRRTGRGHPAPDAGLETSGEGVCVMGSEDSVTGELVETVLGSVAADELGITMAHEHLFVDATVNWVLPREPSRREVAEGPVTMERLGSYGGTRRRAGITASSATSGLRSRR